MRVLCFLLVFGAVYTLVHAHEPFRVKFQWDYFNYTWPSPKAYEEAKEGLYIPRNNIATSIKVHKHRIYLAIPRLKRGVPVTLASINATAISGDTAPLLEPFPNWDFQTAGTCSRFQSVQNMEIDPKGRMWVLDNGRVADDGVMGGSEESSLTPCGASLRIFDLENRGPGSNPQLRNIVIPAAVADPRTVDLHDIVLDHEDGGMAYISNADPKNPGIIVFSLQNLTFWKVSHSSMFAGRDGVRFIIDDYIPNQRFSFNYNIHGLALSPASTAGNRTLYYSPLSSFHIYSISTNVLKNKTLHADIDSHVKIVGKKSSQSDGMVMSNTGLLYVGLLGENAISLWDSRQPSYASGQMMISRDRHLMQWPASFAINNDGVVWCLSNRMHLWLNDSINIKEPNFRLIGANVSYTNYQYLEDGSVPPLPEIWEYSGAGSLSFNAISLALATLPMYFMF